MTEVAIADHDGQELVIDTSQVVAVEEHRDLVETFPANGYRRFRSGDSTVTLHFATGYEPYWRTKKTEDD